MSVLKSFTEWHSIREGMNTPPAGNAGMSELERLDQEIESISNQINELAQRYHELKQRRSELASGIGGGGGGPRGRRDVAAPHDF